MADQEISRAELRRRSWASADGRTATTLVGTNLVLVHRDGAQIESRGFRYDGDALDYARSVQD